MWGHDGLTAVDAFAAASGADHQPQLAAANKSREGATDWELVGSGNLDLIGNLSETCRKLRM